MEECYLVTVFNSKIRDKTRSKRAQVLQRLLRHQRLLGRRRRCAFIAANGSSVGSGIWVWGLGSGSGVWVWVWVGRGGSLADGAAGKKTASSSNCFGPKALKPLKTVAQSLKLAAAAGKGHRSTQAVPRAW
jgi:hypothetical protein